MKNKQFVANEDILYLLKILAESEIDSRKKGLLLEEIICIFLSTIPGFIADRKKGQDVYIRNTSEEGVLKNIIPIILVECKYEKDTIQKNKISSFVTKIIDVKKFYSDTTGLYFTKSKLAESEKITSLLVENNIIVITLDELRKFLRSNEDFKQFIFIKQKFW